MNLTTHSLFEKYKPAEKLVPRQYQLDAVNACYDHLRARNDNPVIVIPTGGGKTPVIATICRDAVKNWGGRVLILAHVKELLEQSVDKLRRVCPDIPVGLYSAGLGRRDTRQPIIVAGIQSIYKRADELDAFDLILVDEAHLIPPDGDGMYRQFLADAKIINPAVRIIGLTATPFRLSSGPICTPEGFLNSICYEVGVRQLIVDGYLSPLVSRNGKTKFDTSSLHVRGGEFVPAEAEELMANDKLVAAACAEIVEQTRERKSVLIFAMGIKHAAAICQAIESNHGQICHLVTGDTPADRRAAILAGFQAREFKYLVNVNVLTTGFDAPNIDCVALLRPTLSPGLYYQMAGRGFRLYDGKTDCLVLDFGGNVLRHGPVDMLNIATGGRGQGEVADAPAKECPQCQAVIFAGYARCPSCGYVFPTSEESKHSATASDAEILSGRVTTTRLDVFDTTWEVWTKRGAETDTPKSMRVGYRVGLGEWQHEWICFEHVGFAYDKAVAWWRARSPDPIPLNSQAAVDACKAGAVADTRAIVVRHVSGDKFSRITDYELGEMPAPLEAHASRAAQLEEVPF